MDGLSANAMDGPLVSRYLTLVIYTSVPELSPLI